MKKTTRGGARPGAGRPKKVLKRKPVSLALDDDVIWEIDAIATQKGWSRSETVNKIILSHLGKFKQLTF